MSEQILTQILEQQTKTLEEKFKHHTFILVEDFRKEIQIVAEGHGILNSKLDKHTLRLDSIDNRLDEHTLKLHSIDNRIDNIDNRIDNIDNRIDNIDNRLNEHTLQLHNIDNRLDNIEHQVTNHNTLLLVLPGQLKMI